MMYTLSGIRVILLLSDFGKGEEFLFDNCPFVRTTRTRWNLWEISADIFILLLFPSAIYIGKY